MTRISFMSSKVFSSANYIKVSQIIKAVFICEDCLQNKMCKDPKELNYFNNPKDNGEKMHCSLSRETGGC